ncbi:hypothetical protein CIPAW_06G082000 [Carya illinoinensis]|uniref:Uncharacterized protein n=1 Tax=Carya illinoinensis TaxID=32201 RepID=A0A8T1Q9A5_CARIL|nr:hypothetical protein CIPAW_06G082000 [Carya illinoinensis]
MKEKGAEVVTWLTANLLFPLDLWVNGYPWSLKHLSAV